MEWHGLLLGTPNFKKVQVHEMKVIVRTLAVFPAIRSVWGSSANVVLQTYTELVSFLSKFSSFFSSLAIPLLCSVRTY